MTEPQSVRSQAVVVAGMHRSGTSAVTQVLAGLGCALPKTLMEGDSHNEGGYWESPKIADLNDAILASAGSSWDDWEKLDPAWYESSVAEGFYNQAVATLGDQFGESPLFVLKDPRICRLLPFWKEALARFGASVRIVVPLRNPMEVAASLKKRDAIDAPFAILIWLRNVLDVEADSRDLHRAFVDYDGLLQNVQASADRLAAKLDLRWPSSSKRARSAVAASLKPALRHHHEADADMTAGPSAWANVAFEIIKRWTEDDERGTDADKLDHLRELLDAAADEFALPLALGIRNGQRAKALDDRVEDLEQALNDKDQFIETLDGEIRERDRRVAERDAQIDELTGLLGERDIRLILAEEKMHEQAQAIEALHAKVNELSGLVSARDLEIAATERTMSEQAQAIEALHAKVNELSGLVSARDLEIAATERTMNEQTHARHELQSEVEGLRGEAEAIRQSTSWRVTRPLRLIKTALLGVRTKAALLGFATLVFGVAKGIWRILPLGLERRHRLRTRLLARRPVRLTGGARPKVGSEYRSAVWLDLPNLAFDAANEGSPVPILFDPHFYQTTYEDVGRSDVSPLQHYMRHGAIEGRMPFEIDAATIDPLVESLHRLDMADTQAFAFDPHFYRAAYADVADLDDASAERHFKAHGQLESRVGSRGEFAKQVCTNPCEIPLDFNASEYLRLYPDLAPDHANSTLGALRHYMVSGRWEPRLHTLSIGDQPERDAEVATPSFDSPPLAILLHVYYLDLWPEMMAYIRNIPESLYRLHVNVVETNCTHQFLSGIRSDFPTADVTVGRNVGRDIGGHCQLLRRVDLSGFKFFLLMHTKKSPHLGEGGAHLWRRRLLMPLVGNAQTVVDNLALFDDESVGQIGARRCRDTKLDNNEDKHRQLLAKLGIDPGSEQSEFVSGTMMFLRREIVQRVFEAIKDTPFENGDDKPLAFHLDAQWAHAVERLFGDVVRDMGYRTEWR